MLLVLALLLCTAAMLCHAGNGHDAGGRDAAGHDAGGHAAHAAAASMPGGHPAGPEPDDGPLAAMAADLAVSVTATHAPFVPAVVLCVAVLLALRLLARARRTGRPVRLRAIWAPLPARAPPPPPASTLALLCVCRT